MASDKPDTVPGLGFKDKEKAQETIKNLEGRDPDYQKLAIKGLIGRAKRTLTLTKDKDKLQNINDAMKIFDDWLSNFEKHNLSKENKSYLPLETIKVLLPLVNKYKIDDKNATKFIDAYEKDAKGEYKNLRTISSGDDKPTWDIVRNSELKKLMKKVTENDVNLWKDELPSKEHVELIIWGYSPEASKIKKNLEKYKELLGKKEESSEKSKRRNESSESSSEDESPKKKSKEN